MRLRWAALGAVLAVSVGCGGPDSSGFLSDATTCDPDDARADLDATDYTTAAPVAIVGTNGALGRAAQRMPRLYAEEIYWGARLLLGAETPPPSGLTVSFSVGFEATPDGVTASDAGTIPAEAIPATPGWVTVSFKAPVKVPSNGAYWLQVTPQYAAAETRVASWLTLPGANFATYDHETMAWTVNGALQAAMRLVPCKT